MAVLALGARLIEERRGARPAGGVDIVGSVLVTAAMMVAVYAIVTAAEYGWGSEHTLGFARHRGGAAGRVRRGRGEISNPILPLRVLRMRTLIGASVVRGFLVTGMFGSWVLGSLYLEGVLGYDAWRTGLAFLPTTLAVGAALTRNHRARDGADRARADRARPGWRSSCSRCSPSPAPARARATSPGCSSRTR